MEFLKSLQNKPEPVKRAIMWVGVFLIMAAIFIFWVFTFPSQVSKTEDNEATAKLKTELPSVWQELKTQVGAIQNLWQK